jgi:FkbM family methyltransferase
MSYHADNTRAADHPILLEGLTKAIAEYHILEGGSFQIVHQVARLRELIGKCQPKSIMEIGFNGGHSALLFLAITPPETKVVSFDLGEYAYVFAAKRYIDAVFPGRHTLVTGDSMTTIPNYEEQVAHRMNNRDTAPPLRFDFIFIDGGHQNDIPMKDILNSQRLASGPNTIVAIDDICRDAERVAHYTIEPTKAWAQMVSAGIVSEHGFDDYYELMKRDNITSEEYRSRGMVWGEYCLMSEELDDRDRDRDRDLDLVGGGGGGPPNHETQEKRDKSAEKTAAFKRLRYNYYQNSSKYMDRKQMLEEIHNQHHYHKEHEKLVAVADMYLEYFPTYNKRDTNYVRFYRACSNFTLSSSTATKQFEEIVDTPSPFPSNAPNGVNDNESELPDFIKETSAAKLELLYASSNPCAEIPKIIHLLYFGETEFYNFHHRCIHSMLVYMPDYEIRIYNAREPPAENKYWQDIKAHPRVRIHKMDPPMFFDGFELKHFQYKADVVRLEVLYEHGGVYLDIDMLIVRPFHEIFASGHSFYISEERQGSAGRGSGALINAFLAAKPKNEFIKLWLNEFKSGLRLGIWAHHIRDSNKQLIDNHPHYVHKYRIRVLDWKLFMPLHWQDTETFIRSETVGGGGGGGYEFPPESYGTHLWETILGDIMRKNEFLQKQKIELDMARASAAAAAAAAPVAAPVSADDTDMTIYPEYYHSRRNDQFVDKYITKGKSGGYFIEIGAGDGENDSACYFFERYREWRGLAVEPAKIYETELLNRRANPVIAAVSNVTSSTPKGGAIFYESCVREMSGLKSALESVKEGQEWTRTGFKSYKVDTITLYDLCCQHSSPEYIDYCAIDCQGYEYEILSTFFEENQLSAAAAAPLLTMASGDIGKEEGVNMIVLNRVFSIGFFSVEVSSDKMCEKVRGLMIRNEYKEVTNPYLSILRRPKVDAMNTLYFKYCGGSSGSGDGNSPQLSDRSLSSISSSVNCTPQTIQTPPASPDMTTAKGAAGAATTGVADMTTPARMTGEATTGVADFLHRAPFAEEVVVICLEERPERTKYASEHLTSHGINHSILMNKINTEDTKVGCFRSHINAIRYAQNKNLSSVLILEDDILIRENIPELATIPFPSEDWDILYLGGILTKYDGIDASQKWVKGTIWCNHAYLVKQRMYQRILDFVDSYPNLIELERRNIDFLYTEYIQPTYQCWLANEQYIVQKEGYSEIDGRVKWASGFDWSTFSMKVV